MNCCKVQEEHRILRSASPRRSPIALLRRPGSFAKKAKKSGPLIKKLPVLHQKIQHAPALQRLRKILEVVPVDGRAQRHRPHNRRGSPKDDNSPLAVFHRKRHNLCHTSFENPEVFDSYDSPASNRLYPQFSDPDPFVNHVCGFLEAPVRQDVKSAVGPAEGYVSRTITFAVDAKGTTLSLDEAQPTSSLRENIVQFDSSTVHCPDDGTSSRTDTTPLHQILQKESSNTDNQKNVPGASGKSQSERPIDTEARSMQDGADMQTEMHGLADASMKANPDDQYSESQQSNGEKQVDGQLPTLPPVRRLLPPVKELNTVLNDKTIFPDRDPFFIEIQAPPPFPADLVDPFQRHVSVATARRHHRTTLDAMAGEKRTALENSGLAEIKLHESQNAGKSALTEERMRESIKRTREASKGRADSLNMDKQAGAIQFVESKRDTEEREKRYSDPTKLDFSGPEQKLFKDVLEEVLRPNNRKWAKLCQYEFPAEILWKTDGNLAALVVAYFECCSQHGKRLSLKSFFMQRMPPVMWLRRHLLSLNISFNHFETMPESVFYLRNLVILKARNNPITTISDQVIRLKDLRYLALSFCMIETIPESIFALPSLEILDVSYNLLNNISRDIMRLRTLRVFNVSGNIMNALPACLMRLPRLTSVLAADSYVTLTSGRRSIITTVRLRSLRELAAETLATELTKDGVDIWQAERRTATDVIVPFLQSAHTCEWCGGPRFGLGHDLVKAESIKKLRFASFIICYQVCGHCCRNPYHVFNADDLDHHIAAGVKELDKIERNHKEKEEREKTKHSQTRRSRKNRRQNQKGA